MMGYSKPEYTHYRSTLHILLYFYFYFEPRWGSTKLDDDGCQRDNADCALHSAAIVMGSPYIPSVMQLQKQGSSQSTELNYIYNAPKANNIGYLNGAQSWIQAHPEGKK